MSLQACCTSEPDLWLPFAGTWCDAVLLFSPAALSAGTTTRQTVLTLFNFTIKLKPYILMS
jgi:hypothetical protein